MMDAGAINNLVHHVFVAVHDLLIAVVWLSCDDQNVMSKFHHALDDIINGKPFWVEELAYDEDFHVPHIMGLF